MGFLFFLKDSEGERFLVCFPQFPSYFFRCSLGFWFNCLFFLFHSSRGCLVFFSCKSSISPIVFSNGRDQEKRKMQLGLAATRSL